jgi:hypothetical protein
VWEEHVVELLQEDEIDWDNGYFPVAVEYLTASAKLEKLQRDLVKMYRGRVDQLEGVERRLQDDLTEALYRHTPGATRGLEEQLADMTAWKNHLFEQWRMVEQERDESRAQRDQNFDALNAAMNERNELVDDYGCV